MFKKLQSFTLIELLIVIVIIGILATALVPKLKGMQYKAKVAKATADFKTIEKALILTMIDENRSTYWTEAEIGLGGNPTFQAIYAKTTGTMSTFSNNLSSVPNNNFHSSKQYLYDNDGDGNYACVSGGWWARGVNILMLGMGMNQNNIDLLDVYIDDKLGDCEGKFRYWFPLNGDTGYHVADVDME